MAAAAYVPGVGIDAAAWRGYLGPLRCGQKHRGATPDARPPAGVGGCSARGEPRGAGSALGGLALGWALAGAGPEFSGGWRGGIRVSNPPSPLRWPHTHGPPLVSREVKFGALWAVESPGPGAEGGAGPPRLGGGGVHRRDAEGPETGRAWEAGHARPSQEDSAAAPARRSWGTSTWRPSAT